jgi:hypothetical protein
MRGASGYVALLLAAGCLEPVASWADCANCGASDTFSYFGESVRSKSEWPSSTAWGLSFAHKFAPHFDVGLEYLNDGHFPGHHRDGVSLVAWVPFTWNRYWTASLGAGPFYFFDTQYAANFNGYADVHSVAWLLSADLKLALSGDAKKAGAFLELRYDYRTPVRNFETRSIGFGIGYRMSSDKSYVAPDGVIPGLVNFQFGLYGGKTVVNSFTSQHSTAGAFDIRFQIPGFSEWVHFPVGFSVGGVYEGNAELIRRWGGTGEVWLEPTFWEGRFSVGAGAGGYVAFDKYRPTPGSHVSGVISATLSVRLDGLLGAVWHGFEADWEKHIVTRVIWHRMVTDYSRDTDVLLFGLSIPL